MFYNNGVGHANVRQRDATSMADFGATNTTGVVAHGDCVPGESQMFTVRRCMGDNKPAVLKYPPHSSVPPEKNPFSKGNSCALYDPTAPAGYKFKVFNKRGVPKTKQKRPEDIVKKLNDLKLYSYSPIHIVNELLMYQNKKIYYDLISMKGEVHCPEFVFRATCDDIVVCANGPSKREAKKNTAIAFLNQYLHNIGLDNDITSTISQSSIIDFDREKINVLETKSEMNPVGLLQELCMAHRWQLPEYQYNKIDTFSNYEVQCSLRPHITYGDGRTKQEAKRQAARLMYDKIIVLSQEESMTSSIEENQDTCDYQIPSTILLNDNKSLQENSKLIKNFDASEALNSMDMFFNQLKLSTKPYISNLKNYNYISEFNASSVDILNKIGDEEGFNITYVNFAKKSAKSEVFVQVSIIPLLINIGTGNTMEEAQEMAAYSVLCYLKLLLDN